MLDSLGWSIFYLRLRGKGGEKERRPVERHHVSSTLIFCTLCSTFNTHWLDGSAGFFTGGSLAIRGGFKAARNGAIGCAVLLAVIEGVGIGFQRMFAASTKLEVSSVLFWLELSEIIVVLFLTWFSSYRRHLPVPKKLLLPRRKHCTSNITSFIHPKGWLPHSAPLSR